MARKGKNIPRHLKHRIWIRDAGLCFYCGRFMSQMDSERTIDHVIPKCKKGTSNKMWNLVTACRSCNIKKNDSDPTIEQVAVIMQRKNWSKTYIILGRAIGRAKLVGLKEDAAILISLQKTIWHAIYSPGMLGEMTTN